MNASILGKAIPTSERPTKLIQLFLEPVSAGFPSPAQDYVEQTLDLNDLCIRKPASTYFVRVDGDSMIEAGIYPNDILIVDKSVHPEHGDVVIASFHGEFTVKELQTRPNVALLPRNKDYSPIEVPSGEDLEIFGVVTSVVRNMRRNT